MKFKTLVLAATLASLSLPAIAAGPQRIRGHIISVTSTSFTVKTTGGATKLIKLQADTGYVLAEPATRADVLAGSYIGTATKTVGGKLIALEVTIFPPAMRGAGDGHYAWDNLPDTTTLGAGAVTQSAPVKMTHSSMTNGNVSASVNLPGPITAAGDKQITVTYKTGAQTVLLPPSAPVNKITKADQSALTPGAQVFIVADPTPNGPLADYIVVAGKGAKLAM
jgi:hypothetical protein